MSDRRRFGNTLKQAAFGALSNVPIAGELFGLVELFAGHGLGIHKVARELADRAGWDPFEAGIFVVRVVNEYGAEAAAPALKAYARQVAPRRGWGASKSSTAKSRFGGGGFGRNRLKELARTTPGDLAEHWMNALGNSNMGRARQALYALMSEAYRRSNPTARHAERQHAEIELWNQSTETNVQALRRAVGV